MKKFTTTAMLTFLFCCAMGAQTAVRCSYFMTFGWGCTYPGMFSAQFSPTDSNLTVTPVPGTFAGITTVAVYDDLTCGTLPECTHHFPTPVLSQAALPQDWFACAMEAQPLFIKICWLEKKPGLTK
jgi:hypothetical protein